MNLAQAQIFQTACGPVEACVLRGQEAPVLLLHGTPGGWDQGIFFAEQLGMDEHLLIAPSRPGYRGTPLASGSSPMAQAELCAHLLRELAILPVVVVGISGGGPTALYLAGRHPELVRGLALLAAVTKPWPRAEHSARYKCLTSLLSRRFAAQLLATLATGEKKRLFRTLIPQGPNAEGLRNDLAQFGRPWQADLPQSHAPALILHGSRDGTVPVSHATHVAEQIRGSKLVIIPGADHDLALTHRLQLRNELRRWLGAIA